MSTEKNSTRRVLMASASLYGV